MAKDLVVECEKCGKKLVTDERYLGRKGKCPNCGSPVNITKSAGTKRDGTEEEVMQLDELPTRKGALLRVAKKNDVGIVRFTTSRILDQSNVQQLGEEFDDLLNKHKLRKIVLNFEKISYMSSAVMGKLVSLQKKVTAAGGEIKLCNIASSIYEIFQIMRFDKLFEICKSEDDAVIQLME